MNEPNKKVSSIKEIAIKPNSGYVFVNADILLKDKNVLFKKYRLRSIFKGRYIESSDNPSKVIISSKKNHALKTIELEHNGFYCPLSRLVAYEKQLVPVKSKIRIKSGVRIRSIKGLRLHGKGEIVVHYEGEFLSKQIGENEVMAIDSSYLVGVFASTNISGRIKNDNLFKLLFRDGYESELIINGPAIIYYQTEKVDINEHKLK